MNRWKIGNTTDVEAAQVKRKSTKDDIEMIEIIIGMLFISLIYIYRDRYDNRRRERRRDDRDDNYRDYRRNRRRDERSD